MPRFCIDSCIIGTNKHLVCDEGSFGWTEHVPIDTWHLSGNLKNTDWCLDTLFKLSNVIKLDLFPPSRFVSASSFVMPDSLQRPWQKLMPSRAHRDFVKRLVSDVGVAMASSPVSFFKKAWVPGNSIMTSLQRAKIDSASWNQLIIDGCGNIDSVKSFEPDSEGFVNPVCYDRFGTVTGRLTVKSGPRILTLKREYRKLLESVYGSNGHIVALDFAALEARVLLYEAGRRCDDPDLYGMIAVEMGDSDRITRNLVKGAVISEVYGSNKWALGKSLGIDGKELDVFFKRVKSYFNTGELLARIKKQFLKDGLIKNRYGRPVIIDEPLDNVMLNYYAQSTGVDVTMIGFSQIINKLAAVAPSIRPLFLLHDALLLDVHKEDMHHVEAIKKVKVSGYVQNFFTKVEVIK